MTVFADPDLDHANRVYDQQTEHRENTRPEPDYDLDHLTDDFESVITDIDRHEQTMVARALGVLHYDIYTDGDAA